MIGELPKFFGKNFAIGFFIPAAALEIALWHIAVEYGFRDAIKNILKMDLLIGATLVVFIVWLGAILLMAVNRPLLRTLEGYGKWHPLKCRERKLRNKFIERVLPTIERQREVDKARAQGHPDPESPENHAERLRSAVTDFPDEVDYVLPTRFGNRMRAFEVYSRVVYGLDAIPAWPRLQAVLPAQFRELLEEAKAQVDFAVNLLVGATAALIFYTSLALNNGALPAWWIPLICLCAGFMSYRLSLSAATEWGEYVKSAFDLHRADLAKQLGLDIPRSSDAERAMWHTVSRMMIYRSSARCDELVRYRPLPPPKSLSDWGR